MKRIVDAVVGMIVVVILVHFMTQMFFGNILRILGLENLTSYFVVIAFIGCGFFLIIGPLFASNKGKENSGCLGGFLAGLFKLIMTVIFFPFRLLLRLITTNPANLKEKITDEFLHLLDELKDAVAMMFLG